jgi:hypothetical protein
MAVRVVVMVSPWRSALVVSALPVSRGWQVIPALWTCGETRNVSHHLHPCVLSAQQSRVHRRRPRGLSPSVDTQQPLAVLIRTVGHTV